MTHEEVKKGDVIEVIEVIGGSSKGLIAEVLWIQDDDSPNRLDDVAYFVKILEGPKMYQQYYVPRKWSRKRTS